MRPPIGVVRTLFGSGPNDKEVDPVANALEVLRQPPMGRLGHRPKGGMPVRR